ncbi:MAG: hypothetical protein PHW07_05140 [Sulfurospirillaceae bacterium]|nr:hypothetical protein [Sulfurospirillaceae bacterium]
MRYVLMCVIGTLLFSGCECFESKEEKKQKIEAKATVKETKSKEENIDELKRELSQIDSIEYLETYITNVIDHGSRSKLGYPAGDMDGGYASKIDSPNIARYVVMLSGKKSTNDEEGKKAAIYYSSNCGGCHGFDSKGLNGAFPDLTLPKLQGIVKRKAYLQTRIDTLANTAQK